VGIRELTSTIVNEFVKKIIVHAPEKSTCPATIKLWNGNEKTGRHDLSAMPPCDNQITSL